MFLGGCFAELEDLRIVHVGDQVLRHFAELVQLVDLFQVLQERLLVRVVLELLNQLLDRFSAIRVLLLECTLRDARKSLIDVVAAGFAVTAGCALD